MTKKRTLSSTQINLWGDCQMAWYYRYIQKIKSSTNSGAMLGSVCHKAIEHNYSQKIETGVDVPLKEVLKVFSEGFDKTFANWNDKNIPQVKIDGIEAMTLHHKHLAPKVQPSHVEVKFKFGLEHCDVMGYIDVITKDGWVRDNKISKIAASPKEVANAQQLSIYALAYYEMFDELPVGLAFDAVQKKRDRYGNMKAKAIETTRTEKQLLKVIHNIEDTAVAIEVAVESDDFEKNPDYMFCRNKKTGMIYCSHWEYCQGSRDIF